MQGLYSIGLLIVSNVFMTLAWYGHLKLQEMKVINNWPLYGVILLSCSVICSSEMPLFSSNSLSCGVIIISCFINSCTKIQKKQNCRQENEEKTYL